MTTQDTNDERVQILIRKPAESGRMRTVVNVFVERDEENEANHRVVWLIGDGLGVVRDTDARTASDVVGQLVLREVKNEQRD